MGGLFCGIEARYLAHELIAALRWRSAAHRTARGHRFGACAAFLLRARVEVRRIEVVFSRDANQREQRVSAGVGQCSSHSVRGRRIRQPADRPIGRDPLSRRVGENRGQADGAGRGIDGGGLDGRDLLLAQGLTNNV